MKEIVIKKVETRKDLKTFIFLPEKVHAENKNWMPPLYTDEWTLFDTKKNKSYGYCDYIQLLAWRDSKPVGRIMGLINTRYNGMNNEKTGRFCFLECYNEKEISDALISYVEDWAREKGMNKIIGPYAFSDKDPQGCQVSGFDTPGVIAAPNNAAYLGELIASRGYNKEVDMVEYVAKVPDVLPELYSRIVERAAKFEHVNLIEFKSRKEIKPYIIDILEVMNDTFSHIYGFVPLTDKEKKDFARRYLSILDPAFIKAARVGDEIVGFVIAMPDIGKGIIKARGRLFPFGFIHILRELKKSDRLLMLLGGVREQYRGRGIDAIMGARILESAAGSRMRTLDSHLVLENNKRMRAEYERIGGNVAKTFRVFCKGL